jgi:hypothetical protein
MKSLKKAFLWVRTQFKTHTLRSLLVTVPALLIVTAVLLWGCGVFEERFSYLPDRRISLLKPIHRSRKRWRNFCKATRQASIRCFGTHPSQRNC